MESKAVSHLMNNC